MAETNVMNGGVEPGADAANGADGAMGDGNRSGQDVEKTYSQEEFDKSLQSESDKRVNQALEKAKAEWQKDFESKLQVEKDEAARLCLLFFFKTEGRCKCTDPLHFIFHKFQLYPWQADTFYQQHNQEI